LYLFSHSKKTSTDTDIKVLNTTSIFDKKWI